MITKKSLIKTGIGLAVIGGSIAPLVVEKDWSKCGAMTGQTVDIEKQEIRHKFAYCDEEFVIKFSDVETKVTKTAEGYSKRVNIAKTSSILTVEFDKDGKLTNVINEE